MNKNTYNYIKNILFNLIENKKIPLTSYGIAGSYARGEETENSDLDIVVNIELSLQEIEAIKNAFNVDVDILFLNLLQKEDEELDTMLLHLKLPANEESIYKTVSKEVIWIEM